MNNKGCGKTSITHPMFMYSSTFLSPLAVHGTVWLVLANGPKRCHFWVKPFNILIHTLHFCLPMLQWPGGHILRLWHHNREAACATESPNGRQLAWRVAWPTVEFVWMCNKSDILNHRDLGGFCFAIALYTYTLIQKETFLKNMTKQISEI